jgi:hypothetical protein
VGKATMLAGKVYITLVKVNSKGYIVNILGLELGF